MQIRFWIKWMLMIGVMITQYSTCYAEKFISAQSTQHKSGAQLWVDNCSRCHNYRSPTEFTPNQWNTIMLHMRFQGGLTDQEAKEILDYLTQSSLSEFHAKTITKTNQSPAQTHVNLGTKPTSIKSEKALGKTSGKAIYTSNCVACHGSNGKGVGPSFPDFTQKGGVLNQSSNVLLNNIIHGIGGMPPRGGNPSLTDSDLKVALDYIKRTFSR
ncbi:MAG: cytochrome c5 family protein [Gammaproteobacteria bacterium]